MAEAQAKVKVAAKPEPEVDVPEASAGVGVVTFYTANGSAITGPEEVLAKVSGASKKKPSK